MMDASEMMNFKNWVVAGDVTNEMKYAGRIYKKLKRRDYNVVGFHPLDENEEVLNTFAEVTNGETKFDVLNLVVNPERGLQIVKEAHDYGIRMVLAQPGARSEAIREYCKNQGMEYVEGCTLVELSLL